MYIENRHLKILEEAYIQRHINDTNKRRGRRSMNIEYSMFNCYAYGWKPTYAISFISKREFFIQPFEKLYNETFCEKCVKFTHFLQNV